MQDSFPIPVIQCTQCQVMGFGPIYVCKNCSGTDFRDTQINGIGNVYTHTTIRIAPDAFKDQVPYDICIVELKPGLRVTARIRVPEAGKLKIGDQVVYDKIDEHGYWFKLRR
jgi:uncharacterized protein